MVIDEELDHSVGFEDFVPFHLREEGHAKGATIFLEPLFGADPLAGWPISSICIFRLSRQSASMTARPFRQCPSQRLRVKENGF